MIKGRQRVKVTGVALFPRYRDRVHSARAIAARLE